MNMVRIVRKSESYIYTLSESTVISEDLGKVTVYGISISDKFQKAEVTEFPMTLILYAVCLT